MSGEFVDLILMKVDAASFAGSQAHPVSYILCKPHAEYYVISIPYPEQGLFFARI